MEKEYIVGIDFGHGETSAWVVPLAYDDNNVQQYGEALCLKRSNKAAERSIFSAINADRDGSYSIDNTRGNIVSGFKAPISELNGKTVMRNAYRAFIKEVYRRLLQLNETILKSDGQGETNFYLCIACPTKWNDADRKAYIDFFNDTLKEFGTEVMWVINESDAAYFSHGSTVEFANQCVLIIDYGSSTIDYTVMDCGKKISEDSWSNKFLGASNIESAILSQYGMQKDFQDTYANTEARLNELNLKYINTYSWLRHKIRMAKERSITEGTYPQMSLTYNLIGEQTQDRIENPDWPAQKYKYLFDYTTNLDSITAEYQKAVADDFANLARRIDKKRPGKKIDCVILSGGASLMPWVERRVKEAFHPNEIKTDSMASFVVSKGVALYARKQQEALKKFIERVASHNFHDDYVRADQQATDAAIRHFAPACIEQIRKEYPLSADEIRTRWLHFLFNLNSENEEYCTLVKQFISNSVTQAVRNDLNKTVKEEFGADIDTSGVSVEITPIVMNYNHADFEKGGFFYEKLSDVIGGYIRPFFSWSKTRGTYECDKYNRNVQDWLRNVSANIDYSSGRTKQNVDTICEDITRQVRETARRVFYDSQLFQTTFKEQTH